jgi:membrane associated rhomboid family serine protease
MLIVPIGRENAVLQRHTWTTYSLIAVNVAMFLLFCLGSSNVQHYELVRSWRETIRYLEDRPYLRIPRLAVDLMPRDLRNRAPVSDATISAWNVAREQKEANAMAADLQQRYEAIADVRLAYVPASGSPSTILTSMFLHAGLFHLLSNMLFLFATAPFLEDVYGRPLFIFLYFTGGIVATLVFAARDPHSVIPLVGASGAIAAVMGAYLVRFTRSRLQFLFIPVLFIPHWNFRFFLPAFVVLPLWFLDQVVAIPAEGDSGVAVTAHVAGFAYGFVIALFVSITKIEERFIRGAIERQISWTVDPRLERALAAFQRGDVVAAKSAVGPLLAEQPNHPDALRLALDVALSQNNATAIDEFGARLLLVHSKDREASLDLIGELTEDRSSRLLPQFLARAAATLERLGDRERAIALYEKLASFGDAVPALVKLANVRRSGGDVFGARETLHRALDHPNCSDEWRRRITNTLATQNHQHPGADDLARSCALRVASYSILATRYFFSSSCASMTAMAAMFTMSLTSTPRCSTCTGLEMPCRIGPMTSAPPNRQSSL